MDGQVVRAMSASDGTRYEEFVGMSAEAKDRRFAMRALHDWIVLSRNRSLPSINHLDPRKFDVAWEKCFILRLSDCAETAEFEYCGRSLQQTDRETIVRSGFDPISDQTLLNYATQAIDLVVQHSAPVVSSGTDMWGKGKMLKLCAILLPFSDCRDTLQYLVGGISHTVATYPRDGALLQIQNYIFDQSKSRFEVSVASRLKSSR